MITPTPFIPSQEQDETYFASSAPPLGLIYIATCLQNSGHDIQIIDQPARKISNLDLINGIKQKDPDVVGFSILCENFNNAKFISKDLKEWNPNLKIVLGNYLPTFYSRKILEKYPWLDACVRGEGEETFKDLIKAYEKNKFPNDVGGVTWRWDGKIKENPDRPLIKDLDALPFADRSIVKGNYTNRIGGIDMTRRKFATLASSRGCPFSCNFCACRSFAQGVFRSRSVKNIFDEICELSSQGYREILFVDDNFTLKTKRVLDLCERIKKENLDMVFTCDGRVTNSSYDMFSYMKRANFEILMFGFESGVQRILNYYHKQITPEMTKIAVRHARKAGFKNILGSFLIGSYDETYLEVGRTFDFITNLDIDFFHILFARALPGTQLFNQLVKDNILDEEKYWETGIDVIDLPGAKMKRPMIEKRMKALLHSMFYKPKYLIKTLYRTITSRYRWELLKNHQKPEDVIKFIKILQSPPEFF